jgi:ferric-dicitrate binding protein FerR (iron transport regulator)
MYGAMCDAEAGLWGEAAKAAGVPKREVRSMRLPEEALTDLWRRVDEDEAKRFRQRRRATVFRIGSIAAAACILITIGIGWLAGWDGNSSQSDSGGAANTAGSPAVFAELVTTQGHKPLALNQPITAGTQPQEILLGGMHRVVMNRNTKATFSAASIRNDGPHAGKIPYEIQLAQGELYVEVLPGNPFTVKTANARLDITGTKFDVRADGDKTELTLLKGSVCFSQPVGEAFVDVTAGHASVIAGRSAPTLPRETDVLATTAWARNLALTNAIARAQPDADMHLLDSIRNYSPQSKPLDLDSVDYVKWRDEHRDWFASEFPWIFKAREFLKERHDIDADYIELLMVSGDIWQFNYPRFGNQPIPIFNATSVRQVAAYYGVDPAELLGAIAPSAVGQPSPQPLAEAARQYRSALHRWQSDVAELNTKAPQDDSLMFALRAGMYLANTRTAAWAWARTYPEQAASLLAEWRQTDAAILDVGASSTFQQWLDRLSHDAAAADNIRQIVPELLIAPRVTGCETQAMTLNSQLAKAVVTLLRSEDSRQ